MIDAAFWRGRHVLLTGHTGFKGAWLSLWLQEMGAHLTGFSLGIPTVPSLFEVAGIATGMDDQRGDIKDIATISRVVRAAAPEIVIHAAAQSLVRPSYADPLDTFAVNILGTANLLEAIRHCASVRAVLIVTSDKCYENISSGQQFRETDPLGGLDPYSASKGAAELVTAAMRHSYFHPDRYRDHHIAVATARAGNVIGGGDWSAERLVPDLIRAFSCGEPALVRNPDFVRPWQFVLDPLAGYLALCEQLWHGPRFAEAWNFGPDVTSDQTVANLARLAAQLWGSDADIRFLATSGPHEAELLRLDSTKARTHLRWQTKCDYERAIAFTIDWYRRYFSGLDARYLCREHLASWCDLA